MREQSSNASGQDRTICNLLAGIGEDRVREHVDGLTAFGSRSLLEPENQGLALQHLAAKLQEYGYTVKEERYGPEAGNVNLIVERVGSIKGRFFELSAHFDTVPNSPGADDNASGVAAILAIAEMLAKIDVRKTVRLCLFGGEEEKLRGSTHHVEHGLGGEEQLEGIIVFEMIGYRSFDLDSQRTPVRIPVLFSPPKVGDTIVPVANWRSRSLASRFLKAKKRYVPELKTFSVSPHGGLLKDASRSDHLPYWQSGRPAMMLTDTAEFRNPHYHRPSDRCDTLDYPFLLQVTRAAAATLLEWAELAR